MTQTSRIMPLFLCAVFSLLSTAPVAAEESVSESRSPASQKSTSALPDRQKNNSQKNPAQKVLRKKPISNPKRTTATKLTPVKDLVRDGHIYEVEFSSGGERLILEEFWVGKNRSYSVERRRGKRKVLGVASLEAVEFERIGADLDEILKLAPHRGCGRPQKLQSRTPAGRVATAHVCEGLTPGQHRKRLDQITEQLRKVTSTPEARRIAR